MNHWTVLQVLGHVAQQIEPTITSKSFLAARDVLVFAELAVVRSTVLGHISRKSRAGESALIAAKAVLDKRYTEAKWFLAKLLNTKGYTINLAHRCPVCCPLKEEEEPQRAATAAAAPPPQKDKPDTADEQLTMCSSDGEMTSDGEFDGNLDDLQYTEQELDTVYAEYMRLLEKCNAMDVTGMLDVLCTTLPQLPVLKGPSTIVISELRKNKGYNLYCPLTQSLLLLLHDQPVASARIIRISQVHGDQTHRDQEQVAICCVSHHASGPALLNCLHGNARCEKCLTLHTAETAIQRMTDKQLQQSLFSLINPQPQPTTQVDPTTVHQDESASALNPTPSTSIQDGDVRCEAEEMALDSQLLDLLSGDFQASPTRTLQSSLVQEDLASSSQDKTSQLHADDEMLGLLSGQFESPEPQRKSNPKQLPHHECDQLHASTDKECVSSNQDVNEVGPNDVQGGNCDLLGLLSGTFEDGGESDFEDDEDGEVYPQSQKRGTSMCIGYDEYISEALEKANSTEQSRDLGMPSKEPSALQADGSRKCFPESLSDSGLHKVHYACALAQLSELEAAMQSKSLQGFVPVWLPNKAHDNSTSLYTNQAASIMLSYLRLLCNTKDDLALLRIINAPDRDLSQRDIRRIYRSYLLGNGGLRPKQPLYSQILSFVSRKGLGGDGYQPAIDHPFQVHTTSFKLLTANMESVLQTMIEVTPATKHSFNTQLPPQVVAIGLRKVARILKEPTRSLDPSSCTLALPYLQEMIGRFHAELGKLCVTLPAPHPDRIDKHSAPRGVVDWRKCVGQALYHVSLGQPSLSCDEVDVCSWCVDSFRSPSIFHIVTDQVIEPPTPPSANTTPSAPTSPKQRVVRRRRPHVKAGHVLRWDSPRKLKAPFQLSSQRSASQQSTEEQTADSRKSSQEATASSQCTRSPPTTQASGSRHRQRALLVESTLQNTPHYSQPLPSNTRSRAKSRKSKSKSSKRERPLAKRAKKPLPQVSGQKSILSFLR
eukprot:m.31197 g.31197  ORF g.31197 m.31197 type:complete len:996 (-) comp9385_c0_seq1:165-3152(-)